MGKGTRSRGTADVLRYTPSSKPFSKTVNLIGGFRKAQSYDDRFNIRLPKLIDTTPDVDRTHDVFHSGRDNQR
jgi:hypothetical protein